MKVPFLDISSINKEFEKELQKDFNRVFRSGNLILSSEVRKFEESFAQYSGVKYCVGVANGLQGLEMVLRSWDIKQGDEVIVPSNTFIATWLAISSVGAIPVPVEPDLESYNINPSLIEEKITSKTKAIIVVHLYGLPCEINKIKKIAEVYSLKILEDAAQSHGAKYFEKRVGGLGDAAAFSFYPAKNLGSLGDGGAITTNDEQLYENLKLLRNYGSSEKYSHQIIGFNSRLDEIQAAFLCTKLGRLDSCNERRRNIAIRYIKEFSSIESIITPKNYQHLFHVFHLFVIRHPQRERFCNILSDFSVETLLHYPVPPHLQKAYSFLDIKKGELPISEKIHKECISLPIYPSMSDDQIDYVISTVKIAADKI